jgi:GNAT superfamily N-acetyltransferase
MVMPTLRTATPADIPSLHQLIAESVRGLSTAEYTPAQIESALMHVFGVDTQLVADGTYYVMVDGDTVVAAGGWSARQTLFGGDQHKSDTDLTIDPAVSPARIRAFFVHPAWARRGLARQIFDACETAAVARGFRRFELMATLPGVPLYRALGFVGLESVTVPLPDGLTLPCIRMDRPIGADAAPPHQISPTVKPSGKGSSGSTT